MPSREAEIAGLTESGKQPSRRAGLHVRDWLLANDPAFSRLRLGLRVTLTIVISTLILAAVHVFAMRLPPPPIRSASCCRSRVG